MYFIQKITTSKRGEKVLNQIVHTARPQVSSNRNQSSLSQPQTSDSSGKDKRKMVGQLFQEWDACNVHSLADRKQLAKKTLSELLLTDDLVELIMLCQKNGISYILIDLNDQIPEFIAERHKDLINGLISMTGNDDQVVGGSFWFKTQWASLVAGQLDEDSFTVLIRSLDGVPLRTAVQGYAAKITEMNPTKALDLILKYIPTDYKHHRMPDGKSYDMTSDGVARTIQYLTDEQCMNLFYRIPIEDYKTNSGMQYYFGAAFGKIFDRFTQRDYSKGIELITEFPTIYNYNLYSRLLSHHRDDPEVVMKHIPKGAAYDTVVSYVTIPAVPEIDRGAEGTFVPKMTDYLNYYAILDSIKSLADATENALTKKRLLDEIEKARTEADILVKALPDQ